MGNRSNLRDPERQRIALDYLKIAADDLSRATVSRIRYAVLGRGYGLTNAAIGEALGITEGAVRALIGRNADIASGND